MSFWGRASIAVIGAAVGYAAAKRGPQIVRGTQDLVRREPGDLETPPTTVTGGTMATFWNSAAARPLRNGALKAVKFAATVKQGMAEKEDELTQRFAAQKDDLRPGSVDTWDKPLPAERRHPELSQDFFTGSGADPSANADDGPDRNR